MVNVTEREVLDAVSALLPEWPRAAIEYRGYLPGGYSNSNHCIHFSGDDYIFRIPMNPQPYVDRLAEQAWLLALPENIAAKPVALNTFNGHMLTPEIKGELLVEAYPKLQAKQLLDYLKTLHAALPQTQRKYDVMALLSAYGMQLEPSTSSRQMRLDADHSADFRSCHNDLNPWNVIISADNHWTTLDWEFAGLQDPLFDLIALHQGLELDIDLFELAENYLSDRNVSVIGRTERCLAWFWLREHAWAHYQLALGNIRAEIEQQLTVSLSRLDDLGLILQPR